MRLGNHLGIIAFIVSALVVGDLFAKQLNYSFTVDGTFYYKTEKQSVINTKFNFNNIKDLKHFPLSFNRWRGKELLAENMPVVKPDFMFEREYANNKGKSLWFQLIRGRIERAVHVPAICYYNSGWQILEHTPDNVKIDRFDLPCARIVAKMNDTYATELYFYLWENSNRDFMKGCTMFRIAYLGADANDKENVSLIKEFIRDIFNEAK
jgi:hypothetical protein